MRLKFTLDFSIYLIGLSTALRRLPPVLTHDFLLFLLVLPGNWYSDPDVAVRTAVCSGGKRAQKENATTAANRFWRRVIGRISCPTAKTSGTCPTNLPRHKIVFSGRSANIHSKSKIRPISRNLDLGFPVPQEFFKLTGTGT